MKDHLGEPSSNLPARRIRHDGWTIARQEKFLEALAACGCITDACRAVGMSRESAHNLYNDPRAHGFRRGFDAALDCAAPVIESGAWERAVKGVARPIFYKGEQVGEYRHYNDRLAMFLLRYRRPHRYGAHLDRLPPPPPLNPPSLNPIDDQIDPDDAIGALEYHLDGLIDEAELKGEGIDAQQASDRANVGVNFVNFVGNDDGKKAPPPSAGEGLGRGGVDAKGSP